MYEFSSSVVQIRDVQEMISTYFFILQIADPAKGLLTDYAEAQLIMRLINNLRYTPTIEIGWENPVVCLDA